MPHAVLPKVAASDLTGSVSDRELLGTVLTLCQGVNGPLDALLVPSAVIDQFAHFLSRRSDLADREESAAIVTSNSVHH